MSSSNDSSVRDLLLNEGIDLERDRLFIAGPVDQGMFKKFYNGLSLLNGKPRTKRKAAPITVAFSTYGGDVDYALAVYDLVKSNSRPVRMIVAGPCMSAGTLIIQAAQVRAAFPSSTFLVHYGHSSQSSMAEFTQVDRQHRQWCEMIAARTKMPLPTVARWHDGETYFNATEALANGLIDEIAEAL